jgi:hypothetical protein
MITMASWLNRKLISRTRRRFIDEAALDADTDHAMIKAQQLDIERLRIIKRRRDTKVVARGVHSAWGDVILKVCNPIHTPHKAYTQLHIDSLLVQRPSALFPRLHDFGLGFSVMELVPGPTADHIGDERLENLALTSFADELAAWCQGPSANGCLTTSELCTVVRAYIDRSLRRLRYKEPLHAIGAYRRLLRGQRESRAQIGRLLDITSLLELPRTTMVGDIHPLNLIAAPQADRIVLVDYEEIRPGHFGFDAAYLLVCLIIRHGAKPALERLASHVFRDAYLGSREACGFYRLFATYMLTTFLAVDGAHDDIAKKAIALIRDA